MMAIAQLCTQAQSAPVIWSRGVTVSTLDSESSDRGSNPRETCLWVHFSDGRRGAAAGTRLSPETLAYDGHRLTVHASAISSGYQVSWCNG